MGKYKCSICGYAGDKLVFQVNDYTYCLASNEEEPEFIDGPPDWVKDKGVGDTEIGEPVGCPRCHAWGMDEFQITE